MFLKFDISNLNPQYIAAGIGVIALLLVVVLAIATSPKKKNAKKEEEAPKVLDKKAALSVEEEKTPVKEAVTTVEPQKEEKPEQVVTETKEAKTEEKVETQKKVEVELDAKVKGKYEIIASQEGFKFVLKASNGQSLITSENYTTLNGCRAAIKRLQENSKTAEIKIKEDKQGNFQFQVINGTRVIAHSANYSSQNSAQKASVSFTNFVLTENIAVKEGKVKNQPELVNMQELELDTEAQGKIVIVEEDDKFSFKLLANNGQTICQSSAYKTLSTIKSNITKFKEAVYNGKFYIAQDKNKNYQFKLYTNTDRLIMTGETFQSSTLCKSNIQSCYRFARDAQIEENIVE